MQWETVLTTGSLTEALLVHQLLSSYGLHCTIIAPAAYNIFPFSYHERGWYRVRVWSDEAEEARQVLEEFRKGGTPVLTALAGAGPHGP